MITDEIERISGYPPHNFLASTSARSSRSSTPRTVDTVLEAIALSSADNDEPFELEYRIVRADGEVRWVLDRGQLVRGPGGRLWLDGAMFDITERRAPRRRAAPRGRGGPTAELRASRARIIEAADKARRKIERDLHDGAQQRMVSLVLDVQVAKRRFAKDPTDIGPFLEKLGQRPPGGVRRAARARPRHPPGRADRARAPGGVGAVAARCAIPVEVVDELEERLPPAVEATAYFTVAEALTNVAKYAEATHAVVRADAATSRLVVEVRDDGIGGASTGSGSGLSGLADRVGALDGTLSVESPPVKARWCARCCRSTG